MSPTAGGVGDVAEVKDINANVSTYVSSAGEFVPQYGLVLGPPLAVTANTTVPASASYVVVKAITGAITLTLPAANAVTPGHLMTIGDGNGSISSSATVATQTATSASGKIGGVAAGSASTSAASYAFLNAAWTTLRLISDGVNWNPA